jgi:YHS domain-containing protein
MKTIDTTPPQPAVVQPPPMLTDEAPPPKTSTNLMQADAPPPPTPQDEALRASLPFSPAIGLDPVDGTKISIRATTPTAELKGHVYYFDSEANKQTFMANPAQYLHGPFALPKS